MTITPKPPLRVGMIGGGLNSAVGRVHEIAMKMDNAFDLQAGCFSRNSDINHASAQAYRIAPERTWPTLTDLLRHEADQLDVLVIATPMNDHAQHIHQALDAGLTVISDKPLVNTLADSTALLKRLGADSCRLFSIFNYTGYPAVREMRRQIQHGQLGQVFKIMAEMPQDSYMRLKNQHQTSNIQAWRLVDGDIPCLSLDLFVHIHSLVYFLTEQHPEHIHAWSRSISQVSPNLIDEVDTLIHYSNQLTLSAWYGKAALGQRNGLKLRIMGTQGSLEWLQEQPETLRSANARGDISILDRIAQHSPTTAEARYNRFKAGHPSGFIEAFANYYSDIAHAIHTQQLNEYTLPLSCAHEGIATCEGIARASQSHSTPQRPV